MKDKNFITEIERLCASHFGQEYPGELINHAHEVEKCHRCGAIPEKIRYAFFKITMRCNSDCAYCEHAYSRNQGKLTERSIEEILPVLDGLEKMGVKACSVSGGEPLIYKDIEAVIGGMVARKIEPILLTNGILLPKKLESVYKAGQRYIIMSIDSFDREHYKKNRGIDFESVMKSYDYVLRFRETHPDLVFNVTAVLSENNQRDVIELIEKCTKDGVNVQLTPYHNFINGENSLSVTDACETERVIRRILEMKDEGYLILNSREYLEYFSDFFRTGKRIPRGQYQCLCGYEAVYIWPNLTVRSCWSTSLPTVGDLKEKSLPDIWMSESYSEQRRAMAECRCEGCWLLCTAEFNITRKENLLEKR